MTKHMTTLLMTVLLVAAMLLGCTVPAQEYDSKGKVDLSSQSVAAKSSVQEILSASDAEAITLAHAGVTDPAGLKTELDEDDGVKEYEIEFRSGNYEYDYTIDAVTGNILSHDKEFDPADKPVETTPAAANPPVQEILSASDAESIALAHAGVTDPTGLKTELDEDDGVKEYEIEFCSGDYEYEYTIDAITGDILSHDKELND